MTASMPGRARLGRSAETDPVTHTADLWMAAIKSTILLMDDDEQVGPRIVAIMAEQDSRAEHDLNALVSKATDLLAKLAAGMTDAGEAADLLASDLRFNREPDKVSACILPAAARVWAQNRAARYAGFGPPAPLDRFAHLSGPEGNGFDDIEGVVA